MSKRDPETHLTDDEIRQEMNQWLDTINPGGTIHPRAKARLMRATLALADDALADGVVEEFNSAMRAADPILSQFSDEEYEKMKKKYMEYKLREVKRDIKRG